MALAPIYCGKCQRRTSPTELISALGDKAVGECCAIKSPKKVLCSLVGEYETLDFGDLMEYFKFKHNPNIKDTAKTKTHIFWKKELGPAVNELHQPNMVMYVAMYINNSLSQQEKWINTFACTEPMTVEFANTHKTYDFSYVFVKATLSELKEHLVKVLK